MQDAQITSMTTPMPAPERINLSAGEDLLYFSIHGYDFEVECADACDRLAKIERQHKSSALECLECGAVSAIGEPDQKITCPMCHSAKVGMSQIVMDAIAALVRTVYGAPRCSSGAATAFYRVVVERMDSAKKNTGKPAESATGTESTPAIGAA